VRIAKERLSRAQSADFVVPLLDTEVHLTRDELEELARPVLDQTVRITQGLIRWADLPEGRLAGVFLVGGASRIPLVATLLHRELGEAPVVIEQPELVVAEGSILADAALLTTGPAAPGPTAELRLVSSRRAESSRAESPRAESPRAENPRVESPPVRDEAETVPVPRNIAAQHIPGTTGLQPAVDPWPDAAHGNWVPDPHATVATAKPRFDGLPRVPPPPPDPTPSASRPMSPARPVSPPPRSAPVRSTPVTRSQPVTPMPPPARVAKAKPAPAPKQRRPRKRRGGFVRFLQLLFSFLVMLAVPVAALVLSYGYGNGESIEQDAVNVFEDILRITGISG
jgi:Hsp70 protein